MLGKVDRSQFRRTNAGIVVEVGFDPGRLFVPDDGGDAVARHHVRGEARDRLVEVVGLSGEHLEVEARRLRGGRDLIRARGWVAGYGHGSSPKPGTIGGRRSVASQTTVGSDGSRRALALDYARDEPLEARKCDGRTVTEISNATSNGPSKPPQCRSRLFSLLDLGQHRPAGDEGALRERQ